MILTMDLNGTVMIPCDRCLEELQLSVSMQGDLYVKVGDPDKSNEDVVFISPDEYELDLSHHMYEFIMLSLPYRRIHPENNRGESLCNQEMLLKLAKFSTGGPPEGENNSTDPRWDDLKKLMDNDKK